jgi:hypothetical protein
VITPEFVADLYSAVVDPAAFSGLTIERGVKISTLRTRLAEIFVRTGTENQRDLVRLLGLLPPLAR